MAKNTEKQGEKRGPGRPRGPEPTVILAIRAPVSLAELIDAYAERTGQARSPAGVELLRLGLEADARLQAGIEAADWFREWRTWQPPPAD